MKDQEITLKKTLKKVFFDYWTLKVIGGSLLWFYFRGVKRSKVKVIGKENIPKKGTTLFICKHPTMMDPISIISSGFFPRIIYDPASMPWGLAAASNFLPKDSRRIPFIKNIPWLREKPFLQWTLEGVCIPVNEDRNDPTAYREARKKLKAGRNVLIFPEGGRTKADKGIDDFKAGAAALFFHSDVDAVIPVYINDEAKKILPKGQDWPDFSKGTYVIVFGKSISEKLTQFKHVKYRVARKLAYEKITKMMQQELLDLEKHV